MSTYDQKLLGSAPATTKSARQQGYDATLLEKGPTPPPVTTPLAHPHGRHTATALQYGSGSTHGHTRELPHDPTYSKKSPLWKTRKGKTIIAVVVFLVIAIVAGVVGGVVGSRKGSGGSPHPTTAGGVDDGSVSPGSAAPTTLSQDSSPPSGSPGAQPSATPSRVNETQVSTTMQERPPVLTVITTRLPPLFTPVVITTELPVSTQRDNPPGDPVSNNPRAFPDSPRR